MCSLIFSLMALSVKRQSADSLDGLTPCANMVKSTSSPSARPSWWASTAQPAQVGILHQAVLDARLLAAYGELDAQVEPEVIHAQAHHLGRQEVLDGCVGRRELRVQLQRQVVDELLAAEAVHVVDVEGGELGRRVRRDLQLQRLELTNSSWYTKPNMSASSSLAMSQRLAEGN